MKKPKIAVQRYRHSKTHKFILDLRGYGKGRRFFKTRAEAEAVHRAIAMAEIAGAPVYIVHLSSEDALNEVREERDRGASASALSSASRFPLTAPSQRVRRSFSDRIMRWTF